MYVRIPANQVESAPVTVIPRQKMKQNRPRSWRLIGVAAGAIVLAVTAVAGKRLRHVND